MSSEVVLLRNDYRDVKRSSNGIPFDPPEFASWLSGAVTTVFGVLLCTRSSKLTRFLFRLDGALDCDKETDTER